MEDDGQVSALVCDNGSGMVKVSLEGLASSTRHSITGVSVSTMANSEQRLALLNGAPLNNYLGLFVGRFCRR